MSLFDSVMLQLVQDLAAAFPDPERAELLAASAGIDRGWIDTTGAPRVVWQSIVEEAHRVGCVPALVALASEQARALAAKFAADLARYQDAVAADAAPTTAVAPATAAAPATAVAEQPATETGGSPPHPLSPGRATRKRYIQIGVGAGLIGIVALAAVLIIQAAGARTAPSPVTEISSLTRAAATPRATASPTAGMAVGAGASPEGPTTVAGAATPTLAPTAGVTAPLPPTVTATPEPTVTARPTATPEPTATATLERTATLTPEPTATLTSEPTATASPTVTLEPTATPTVTATPSATATASPTATLTPTRDPYYEDIVTLINQYNLTFSTVISKLSGWEPIVLPFFCSENSRGYILVHRSVADVYHERPRPEGYMNREPQNLTLERDADGFWHVRQDEWWVLKYGDPQGCYVSGDRYHYWVREAPSSDWGFCIYSWSQAVLEGGRQQVDCAGR